MTDLDDDILLDAERAWESAPARKRALVPAIAATACAALVAGGVFMAADGPGAARLSNAEGTPVPEPDRVIRRVPQPDEAPPVNLVPGSTLEVPGDAFAVVFINAAIKYRPINNVI